MKHSGTVKFFDPRKGWGIIRKDDGQEIFVHHTGIQGARRRRVNLQDGEPVTFTIEDDPRGPKAHDVARAVVC